MCDGARGDDDGLVNGEITVLVAWLSSVEISTLMRSLEKPPVGNQEAQQLTSSRTISI